LLCLSFFIVACGQQSGAEKAEIPQLNDTNIHEFSISLSKDYFNIVDQLITAYINAGNTKPLFLAYENLIYIGVDLKNSLLDENIELEKEALTSLKQDKTAIKAVLKATK